MPQHVRTVDPVNLGPKVPMGRMGKLDELEGTIVYLASSASD
jgi:NAD(P)-dependent dehydrogenase (short-subunit alcohol dehydrogenase family)